ncbi:regulator of G-protein signaling 4 [Takifugu flavidus]|uniref:Regulator of G-protein signaling 4 n=1 Tax=Takifugu flavidus TaxID=433684 RepID=A0A5C6MTK6_9TELE|nr:regulator of G-protein signaling 4 [Takifugu flavidus]TWW58313.1 Regulator of G-protein signaling 4 [Takifugu flavidus]
MCKGLATLPATCLKSAKDIKHKISFLLQKPEHQTAEPKQKEKSAAAAAAATAAKRVPAADQVKKWNLSFSHVMNSEMGRQVFASFLRSEFSEENMDFWVACEEYRKMAPSDLAARAQQIYQLYIESDAPKEVNLDAVTREETRQNVDQAHPSCFDEAQKMIYILMEKDSYRRFLHSTLVQDLLERQAKREAKSSDCLENRHVLAGGA